MTVTVRGARLLPPSARRPGLVSAACRKALRGARADGPGELSVVFVSRAEMRRLNKRFLRHDYDTDVIAFPYSRAPKTVPGEPFGDVFVSAYMVRLQAKGLGHSPLEEALTLAVHGTLHLLGYDDHGPRKKAAMFRRQGSIVRATLKA